MFSLSNPQLEYDQDQASCKLGYLKKIAANIFALLDPEENTSGTPNIGGTADLPLTRALLATSQKLWVYF